MIVVSRFLLASISTTVLLEAPWRLFKRWYHWYHGREFLQFPHWQTHHWWAGGGAINLKQVRDNSSAVPCAGFNTDVESVGVCEKRGDLEMAAADHRDGDGDDATKPMSEDDLADSKEALTGCHICCKHAHKRGCRPVALHDVSILQGCSVERPPRFNDRKQLTKHMEMKELLDENHTQYVLEQRITMALRKTSIGPTNGIGSNIHSPTRNLVCAANASEC